MIDMCQGHLKKHTGHIEATMVWSEVNGTLPRGMTYGPWQQVSAEASDQASSPLAELHGSLQSWG